MNEARPAVAPEPGGMPVLEARDLRFRHPGAPAVLVTSAFKYTFMLESELTSDMSFVAAGSSRSA